jgi:hypothetical protein
MEARREFGPNNMSKQLAARSTAPRDKPMRPKECLAGRQRLPAVSSAATTATARSAASATTAAGSALRTCLVYRNRSAIQIRPVQRFDRGPRLVVTVHGDKREPSRAASFPIRNHCYFFHLPMGLKLGLQRFLSRRKGKVANIQLHRTNSKLQTHSTIIFDSYEATKNHREIEKRHL